MGKAKVKESETDIVRAVCDYLALRGMFFWRQNTAPTFDWKTKSFRAMPKYAMRGIPDIILVRNGQFIGIEIKKQGGILSDYQKDFCALLRANGGQYHVVKSVDDAVALGL